MMDIRKQLASRLKNFRSGGWDGRNLSIWSPDHPLNQAAAFAGSSTGSDREKIENDFEGYVQGAYKANGPVFACVTARQFVFSEAVFKFRSKQDGKLFGSPELSILETPWPGGTTGELLSRMEQDVSLTGNSWWTLTNDQGDFGERARRGTGLRLARLRPDWVTMVIASKSNDPRALDAHLAGVVYTPQAAVGGRPAAPRVLLKASEVAHYSPIPDPAAQLRGISWMTPVLREIEADKGATKHKGAFFDNAAVPNMAVTFDKETSREDFEEFVEAFNGNHSGAWQAYKTLFLMGGADVTPLSHDFRSMDFSGIVGKGESRIASAAQVPPSWVGFSEGMQGSALNSGNMAANRRRFADGTIRPLWRMAVASLSVLLRIPAGAELWWDESGIAFLREDQRDRAEIMRIDMNAVDAAIKAGFEPDAAVAAVESNDIRKLLTKHTGLVSVQMQPPVDPDNEVEETQGQANIMEAQAKAIQAFITAGFTAESAVEAVDNNDLSKLKNDPKADIWSPTGQALMTAPPGSPGAAAGPAKPAGPGAPKPAATPAKPAAAAKPAAPKKP
ncbi:phage portal protein [Streptomyces sp. NPDC048211]|uniref:phage portal protein n=1 Tax=Streptomyces sp. NPDC048211 TaxID=3365516 RepID=UPI00371A0256